MDFTQFALLGLAIAGSTELISRIRAKDLWVVATIVTAAIIGGLFGAFHYYPDLDWVEGVVAGLAASGGIKVLGSVGNKSTPAPSTLTEKSKK